jgi:hypothetical protein
MCGHNAREKMNDVSMVEAPLSSALIAYVGKPGRVDDTSPEERVAAAVGPVALDLVPRVKGILDELYDAEPPIWGAPSVAEIGQNVVEWLNQHHPELSPDAIAAAAKRLSFDWK